MGQEQVFDDLRRLARSPRRRFRIGDLMIGIAMTATGLSAVVVPELTSHERFFLGLFAAAFLALLWAQWAIASLRCTVERPVLGTVVGFVSALIALSMFVSLFLVGLVFPQGAALLSVMMLIQVVYLVTWE
jgi:hypothetical protein